MWTQKSYMKIYLQKKDASRPLSCLGYVFHFEYHRKSLGGRDLNPYFPQIWGENGIFSGPVGAAALHAN